MCRLCYTCSEDVIIPPVKSKFNRQRFLNKNPIHVPKDEIVLEAIKREVPDPYEQLAVYMHFMFGHIERFTGAHKEARKGTRESPLPPVIEGTEKEWREFEKALLFLAQTNPTRMKTIEQLELNYRKSLRNVKQQRVSAQSSLQTRQSLEMDMLTGQMGGFSKNDIESLVHQHCVETDTLVSHWESEIRSIQQRQLREYRDLVMEVVHGQDLSGPLVWEKRTYGRPEIEGLRWISMQPVALTAGSLNMKRAKPRLVRVTLMEGEDFLSTIVSPKEEREHSLDPEEECAANIDETIVSAVILGVSNGSFKSNQDLALLKIVDTTSASDCRWPSLAEQFESLGTQWPFCIGKTRHSNIAHGIIAIYFLSQEENRLEDQLVQVFEDCDRTGVKRVFVPNKIEGDLLAPPSTSSSDEETSVDTTVVQALKRIPNIYCPSYVSLDEIVIIGSAK
jgi:hypothetical protein